jgi:hypothetical protein
MISNLGRTLLRKQSAYNRKYQHKLGVRERSDERKRRRP